MQAGAISAPCAKCNGEGTVPDLFAGLSWAVIRIRCKECGGKAPDFAADSASPLEGQDAEQHDGRGEAELSERRGEENGGQGKAEEKQRKTKKTYTPTLK